MVVERSEPNLSHLHGETPPPPAANLEWRMGSLTLDPVARSRGAFALAFGGR